MLLLIRTPALLGPGRLALWLSAFVVFGVGFWQTSRAAGAGQLDRTTMGWLGIQTVAALAMLEIICTGFESVLLVVVAAQLGLLFRFRAGLGWIVLQTMLIGWFSLNHWTASIALGWTEQGGR